MKIASLIACWKTNFPKKHPDSHFYKFPIMGVLFQKPFPSPKLLWFPFLQNPNHGALFQKTLSIPSTRIMCNDSFLVGGPLGRWPKKWIFLIKSPFWKLHRWSLVGKPIFRKSIMIPISTKSQSWEYCSQNPFHPLNYRDYRLYKIPIMGHCSKKPVDPLNPHHVQWFFLSALPGENWPRWTLYGGMLGRRPKKWTCLIKRPFENCIVDRLLENPFSKEVSWLPFLQNPNHGHQHPASIYITCGFSIVLV